MVHPFEGPFTALGTATLGLEFWEQAPHCDMFVAAVGGVGLAAGVSRALKLLNPGVTVIGVESFGADTMWRSFMTGAPRDRSGGHHR